MKLDADPNSQRDADRNPGYNYFLKGLKSRDFLFQFFLGPKTADVLRAPPSCLYKARDSAFELGVPSHVVQHREVPPKQQVTNTPMADKFALLSKKRTDHPLV